MALNTIPPHNNFTISSLDTLVDLILQTGCFTCVLLPEIIWVVSLVLKCQPELRYISMQYFRYRHSVSNHIDSVMIRALTSSVVDRGFEPWSGQTKDYTIGICCFSSNHVALRRKSKIWLAGSQDNVSSGARCLSADSCFSELGL